MKKVKVTVHFKNKIDANACHKYMTEKKAKIVSVNKQKLEMTLEVVV